ncbi:hypothetical protein [Actinoallomurus rhizosphaericola]|uniref:hypothetical protein n=1 Tax=Actinoallomurus rhizosphaericola TaxID=2952536 RepID=UPI002090B31C|nr:hypothetical protein [Actinoallomurus rhizosphaericola]MCO5994724.1 hypothetical protein [Actinoallomurus rhizosphaericola]
MRAKGINYDTGLLPGGRTTREVFDPGVVRREMRIIADDLHCTAVRISGGDPERLTVAAEHAAAAGLEIWFAPFPCELTPERMLPLFTDCAERAEDLRRGGAETVLVTGCEVSLFAAGFIPGEDVYARIAALASGDPAVYATMREVPARVNAFFAETVAAARKRFGGRITYAAGPWESIDWTPFDLVSADAYRAAENADRYVEELRALFAHGKPVAVTEFGCCTYRGAAGRGGIGWAIVDRDSDPPRLNGDYVRDEVEQATYLRELLEIFEREGVDSAFWFTFAGYELPYRPDDPAHDLDLASYGVVKVLENGHGTAYPDMSWEPKESFHTLAAAYAG